MAQEQAATPLVLLRDALARNANADGGWAYYPGKASRLEPTCWALLAPASDLAADDGRHRAFLEDRQQPDGWLVEHTQWPVNIALNAAAAVTWLARPRLATDDRRRRLLSALAGSQGIRAEPLDGSPQDNTLQGWAWTDGTFTWVEPTAWGLLAMKMARRAGMSGGDTGARIDEAERVLIDRTCRDGGWNFGNARVLYQDLRPYVPTTALALVALQDRPSEPAVVRSLDFLESHWSEEISAVALGLTLICLATFGRPTDAIERRLGEHVPRALEFSNLHGIATALVALSPESRHVFQL